MKFAIVFPGQGSQSVNMLADLASEHSIVAQTFAEASDVLGYSVWDLICNNPDNKLNVTEYTQPAMLAAGIAVWRVWCEQSDIRPALMAGHSLGEYSALVAADALSFQDAIRLVAERGRLMQAAVPEGQGAMAAILGLEDERVREVCQQAAQSQLVEAVNFNSPGQVVIAGHTEAVQRAVNIAQQAGAKRALLLPVSVPSHSSLMREAAIELAEYLKSIEIAVPGTPVLHNVDAEQKHSSGAIVEALQSQLYSPVLWVDSVNKMAEAGVELLLEFGPGKVLAGLTRRINRQMQAIAVESPAGLDKAITTINGEV